MTRTPIPRPFEDAIRQALVVVCDWCGRQVPAPVDGLPPGWHEVYRPDYVGAFHACCSVCAAQIVRR